MILNGDLSVKKLPQHINRTICNINQLIHGPGPPLGSGRVRG